jgi:NAD(P) transhydrogenase
MAQAEKFDLVVIGSGPAGEKGAAQVAYFGKKVAIIERAPQVGGAGINTGTVPSKTLRESALYFSGLKQRGLYGIDYSLREGLKIGDFMHHLQQVVDMERRKILKNLELHKIELIQGQAAFEDAHTVSVAMAGGRRLLTADVILIATGSKPSRSHVSRHSSNRSASTPSASSGLGGGARMCWASAVAGRSASLGAEARFTPTPTARQSPPKG